MNKTDITLRIIQNLKQELMQAIHAAEEAHKGATHEQSKAETQYDTIGLEHAYLAEGQSRRIDELQSDMSKLENWVAPSYSIDDEIYLGAIVKLENCQDKHNMRVFITPAGGGQLIQPEGLQVITPLTPLGKILMGRSEGDNATINNGKSYLIMDIQ